MNVNAVPDVKSRVHGRAPHVHVTVKVKAAIYKDEGCYIERDI